MWLWQAETLGEEIRGSFQLFPVEWDWVEYREDRSSFLGAELGY